MKKQAYIVIAMIVLVGSMVVAAQAQTSGRTQLIANIPFEFSAGAKTLPAGKYTIACVNPTSDQKVLQIRSLDGRNSAVLQMHSVNGKTQEGAKLVFHRYGDRYFLAQAWTPADNIGMEAPKSRAERAAEVASNATRRIEAVALSR
jgi:hypothetical protein